MSIEISTKQSRDKKKKWYYYEWGKGAGERKASGIFTYTKPKDQIEKNHNKEAHALLEVKKSQLTIDQQSIGSPFIPTHRYKANFLDFYAEFVENNKRKGNRHLEGSLNQFKLFIRKPRILPMEITENQCIRFRAFLLDHLTGKTPSDYFRAFKRMIRSATKEGYFRIHPAEDIRSKTGTCKVLKDFLEAEEFIHLIRKPIRNPEVRDAFVFCCYTGLRWCDVKNLQWSQIEGSNLVTRIVQKKTGKPVELTLHAVAQAILDFRKARMNTKKAASAKKGRKDPMIFSLPTANGANKCLRTWVKDAELKKKITWHSARLSFSILLQDANVDTATVALLLGHTTTRFVNETYKRFRPKNQAEHINKLPSIEWEQN
jgi:integrase